MGVIVYGSDLAARRREKMRETVDKIKASGQRLPCLAVVLVGDNPASLSYVKGKEKACAAIGMASRLHHLEENTSPRQLYELIDVLNNDGTVDGILVQLPLPTQFNGEKVINRISPDKDVDGLHPVNIGKLYAGERGFVPCTPKGCMALLAEMGCEPDGKTAVVMGRSRLVGAPAARLLQDQNATVTITHRHTRDVRAFTREADILIAAIGQPRLIDASYVKEGAYVIDVGINRTAEGKLVGDVDTEAVLPLVSAVTPVPKGVGPMTISMLMENTLEAYFRREGHGSQTV